MQQVQFIQTTPDDLRASILQDVKVEIESLKKHLQPTQPDELLTRSEVAKMLKIDLSTVHNYTVQGKIQSYGIGRRVYYKRSEIERAIVKL